MILAKTRLRYARGFLALGMLDDARAEIGRISESLEALPDDAVFLLGAINESEWEKYRGAPAGPPTPARAKSDLKPTSPSGGG